jgi:hypothetical protein
MDKIYQRTENGAQTFVDRKTGLGEINEAMMGETKKSVDQMSQISRTDFEIAYRDGRVVRLVLVDAPAPEGYTQGQAVVVQRPGHGDGGAHPHRTGVRGRTRRPASPCVQLPHKFRVPRRERGGV